MKNLMKRILIKGRDGLQYLKYRNSLPKNPLHDDIYIVEFPKSGVTWLQHILGNIELKLAKKDDEYITFYNRHKYLPDIHQVRGAYIHRFLNRTFIKSHSEFNPYYYFVIYLLRNPFDVMVSYYNFMLFKNYKDTFYNFVRSKEFGILRWKRHVNSWLFQKKYNTQRIHVLKYEDLIADTKLAILNIYKNIGVVIQDGILEESIKQSNINEMIISEEFFRKFNPNYNMYFIGKNKKLKKEEILTDNIKTFIINNAKKELKEFYPEFL